MFAPFFAALRFLTVLPVPGRIGLAEEDLSRSVITFPLVGLFIGGIALGLMRLALVLFPQPVAALFLVLVLLAISGGLHLDGLADTADGFFSSRPREKVLEIMRDSRIGPMGVIALVLVLLFKVTALSFCSLEVFSVSALLMPLAGRVAIVLLMALLPYARPQGGLATLFYFQPVRLAALGSFLLLGAVSWFLAGRAGLLVAVIVIATTLLFARACRTKINGATGDTLGAGCELVETVVALVLAAHPLAGLIP